MRALWLMLLSTPALAGALDDCMKSAGPMPAVSACLQTRLNDANAKLKTQEAKTRQSMRELDQVTAGRYRAEAAHRRAAKAFAEYRQRQCAWVEAGYASGNGAGQGRAACEIDLTEQRLSQLSAQ